MTSLSTKIEDRNYGVDAVKIIAMFMVFILHILGKSNCKLVRR